MRAEYETGYVTCEHCGRGQTFFYDPRDPLSWEKQAALALGSIPHQPTCPRFQDQPDRTTDLSKLQTSFC
jgi:hypothetical protein